MADEGASTLSVLGAPAPTRRLDPVLRSFVEPLPPSRWPTPEAHRLEVALVWGADHLLDVREVVPGLPFTIGANADASIQVFHAATDRGPLPLLELLPTGCRAVLPVEARGRVRLGGVERSKTELVEQGLGTPVTAPFLGVRCELGLNDRIELEFDQLHLIARFVRPPRSPRSSRYGWAFRARVLLYLVTATGIHFWLAAMFAR